MTFKQVLDDVAKEVDTPNRRIDVAVTYHVIHTFLGKLYNLGMVDALRVLSDGIKNWYKKKSLYMDK